MERMMVQFSASLEETLNRAHEFAVTKKQEFVCPEAILLSLLEDPDAVSLLSACDIDVVALKADAVKAFDESSGIAVVGLEQIIFSDPAKRIGTRALVRGEGVGKETLNGADYLLSFLMEKGAHAVSILEKHNLRHVDAVNFMIYGVTKKAAEKRAAMNNAIDWICDALPDDVQGSLTLVQKIGRASCRERV